MWSKLEYAVQKIEPKESTVNNIWLWFNTTFIQLLRASSLSHTFILKFPHPRTLTVSAPILSKAFHPNEDNQLKRREISPPSVD